MRNNRRQLLRVWQILYCRSDNFHFRKCHDHDPQKQINTLEPLRRDLRWVFVSFQNYSPYLSWRNARTKFENQFKRVNQKL